jgi:hypothetical protein
VCTALIARVADMHPHLGLMANTSVVAFPDDGLTSECLLQGLARNDRSTIPCEEVG